MKTSSLLLRLLLAAVIVSCPLFRAHAQLEVRVSVKFILDTNGMRLPGGKLSTDDQIRNSITNSNRRLASFGRGYQLNLIEIKDLPGHSDLYPLSQCETTDAITQGVQNNPAEFLWRDDAMNIYINNAEDGHGCSAGLGGVIVQSYLGSIGLHEPCHFFHVCHTQGCGCAECNVCQELQDDGLADTLPDRECWTKDDISTNWFHKVFDNLNPAQQASVSNTFNNIQSYHVRNGGSGTVLTSDQLDRIADSANLLAASNIVSGLTQFVDRTNGCANPNGLSNCILGIGGPFRTVANGIGHAHVGDIVLLRSGHYNEPMTLSKALTFRATRGDALVGKP